MLVKNQREGLVKLRETIEEGQERLRIGIDKRRLAKILAKW
jgi:hypothetical protein